MVEISTKVKIRASRDTVWSLVSRIDNDYEYWHAITAIRNLTKEQDTVTREVYLGSENRCRQKVILFPKEGIHTKWLKGPITGVRDVMLTTSGDFTVLEVQMSYQLSKVMTLFLRRPVARLLREAEAALEMIKEKAEGTAHGPILEDRRLWADLIRSKK